MRGRVSSVVLAVGLTLLGPALSASEATHGGSEPDAVFYELTEHAVFTDDGFRNATSALEGKARRGSPLCPEGLQLFAKRFFPKAIDVKLSPRCRVLAGGGGVVERTL